MIAAVAASGVQTESLTKALELPKESEMDPRGMSSLRPYCPCGSDPTIPVFRTRKFALSIGRGADGVSDKYWTFNVHSRGYRRSVHKEPKWTRVSGIWISVLENGIS